ncbi:MAG TPA: aminopeptidase P family protein [Thermomicrobiales bacterium]|nr:aminopeptidase P family protein [Thermomicrobiales bacterium]
MSVQARLTALRSLLAAEDLDAALITHPANRRYLSGYTADDHAPDESNGVLLVSATEALLFTSPNNVEWAQAEAPNFRVLSWKRPWTKAVVDRIGESNWTRLGFEDQSILYATVRALQEAFPESPALVPIGSKVDELRAVKDADELAVLERAIRLTDAIFVDIVANLKPGMTEREIAWRIEREMRERGAEGPAFETIVASGPHAARPHHTPSDRRIQEGEPIIIDMGARIAGYNADLTRTVWLGQPDARLQEVYNVVYEAQAAGLAGIHAGMTGADADRVVRDIIAARGFGDSFVHSLGHGVGIQIHEAPSASPANDVPLRQGEILTVEPGVYLPGWGGVRIEDVVLIQNGGCRVLTAAPKRGPHETAGGRNDQ